MIFLKKKASGRDTELSWNRNRYSTNWTETILAIFKSLFTGSGWSSQQHKNESETKTAPGWLKMWPKEQSRNWILTITQSEWQKDKFDFVTSTYRCCRDPQNHQHSVFFMNCNFKSLLCHWLKWKMCLMLSDDLWFFSILPRDLNLIYEYTEYTWHQSALVDEKPANEQQKPRLMTAINGESNTLN